MNAEERDNQVHLNEHQQVCLEVLSLQKYEDLGEIPIKERKKNIMG
jgi:hypothetical protein